ncbi:MAG: sulfatase-like hydrolase/transferase, partial [Victivallaceae bacterium]
MKPETTPEAVTPDDPPATAPDGASATGSAAGTEPGSILKITLVSLLLGSSFVTPGVILYLRNSSEFTFRLQPLLLGLASVWFVISMVAFLLQYPARRTKYFAWIHAGLLSLGLTVYLQSAFFMLVFSADAEDAVLPDSGMALMALLDLFLLAAPVVLALIFRKPICHSSVKLTVIILLSQLSPLAWELSIYQPTNYDYYDYAIDSNGKFTFANRENIILVMVDSMSEMSLKKALHDSPQLTEALKDFSCFDRLESPIPRTRYAVPSMISGQEFPADQQLDDDDAHLAYLRTSSTGPDSLIVNLKKQGFRMEGYPFLLQTINYNPRFWDNIVARVNNTRSIGQFLDVWFYQITPFVLKYCFARQFLSFEDHFVTPSSELTVFPGETHDMVFLRRLLERAKIGTFPKGFKYYHLQGSHSPYTIDETAEKNLDTDEVRQLRGSMRNVEILLEKLKQFGLYDQSLIVITGDHTEFYTPETIMMIKRPGDKQNEITFHSQPCKVREIATTI